jgi:hypothetical protein
VTWSCVASVSFRPEPARCVAFSTDGSLLAVSYGRHITLWHPLEVRPLPFLKLQMERGMRLYWRGARPVDDEIGGASTTPVHLPPPRPPPTQNSLLIIIVKISPFLSYHR